MKKIVLVLIVFIPFVYAGDSYYYKNNKKVNITPAITSALSRSGSSTDYYKNDKGIVFGVTDKLIVKLNDARNLEKYLKEFDLKMEKTLSKNTYLLKTKNKSLTIDISNRLNEKEDVQYSHPDFLKKRMKR